MKCDRLVVLSALVLMGAGVTPAHASGGSPSPSAAAAAAAGPIAYSRDGWVWTMNADGTGARRFTPGSDPEWSPDGRRLAFTRDDRAPGACCPDSNVYVMNADGTGLTRVTSTTLQQFRPSWSPDGGRLAFTANSTADGGGTYNIYTLRSSAPFGSLVQVTRGGGDFLADWSTATGKLLYGCGNQVCTVGADGTGRRQLTSPVGAHSSFPGEFSPDGKRIAYSSDQAADPFELPPLDLWRMNADGTGKTRLTNAQSCCLNGDDSPTWSPDGRQLVFSSDRNGPGGSQSDLYRVPSAGGAVVRLTRTSNTSEGAATWRR